MYIFIFQLAFILTTVQSRRATEFSFWKNQVLHSDYLYVYFWEGLELENVRELIVKMM